MFNHKARCLVKYFYSSKTLRILATFPPWIEKYRVSPPMKATILKTWYLPMVILGLKFGTDWVDIFTYVAAGRGAGEVNT